MAKTIYNDLNKDAKSIKELYLKAMSLVLINILSWMRIQVMIKL